MNHHTRSYLSSRHMGWTPHLSAIHSQGVESTATYGTSFVLDRPVFY